MSTRSTLSAHCPGAASSKVYMMTLTQEKMSPDCGEYAGLMGLVHSDVQRCSKGEAAAPLPFNCLLHLHHINNVSNRWLHDGATGEAILQHSLRAPTLKTQEGCALIDPLTLREAPEFCLGLVDPGDVLRIQDHHRQAPPAQLREAVSLDVAAIWVHLKRSESGPSSANFKAP